jgi:3-phenylpropionate/cinnamic acid dioxygenase small subunit
VSALITLEQINTFNATYARSIDEDQLEIWPEYFAAKCFYKITTAENVAQNLPAGLMYADSKGMLQDRVTALREANIYEKQRYRHIVGYALINSQDSTACQSESAFIVARIMRGGPSEMFITGKYIDTFITQGNGIKLASRVVVCDSVSFDTLLAIPL